MKTYRACILPDGRTAHHARDGLLFYREDVDNNIHYHDLLSTPDCRELIKQALNGVETPLFYKALVRRLVKSDSGYLYYYYPLPLVFASAEERQLAAERLGRRPPPERWIARLRKRITEELKHGCEIEGL